MDEATQSWIGGRLWNFIRPLRHLSTNTLIDTTSYLDLPLN
jgi:hypothetical protein